MLNIKEINFPITFHFPDMMNRNVTFESKDAKGVWQDGHESWLDLGYFVHQHNKQNPSNEPHKPHHYKMAEHRENKDTSDTLRYFFSKTGDVFLNGALIYDGAMFTASTAKLSCDMICKIEDMPVGATLLAIKRNAEGWDDVRFTPRRIEIHDDTITLLSGYAGGYSKSGNNYALETNIKRGTKVKYRTNC